MVNVSQWYSAGDANPSFVFLLENNIGRGFVNSHAETFQFRLNHPLVCQGLIDIENDEYEVARFCDSNDLTTSSFAIFGTLDDTGKIEHLYCGTIVHDLTGHCGKSRELVRGSFEGLARSDRLVLCAGRTLGVLTGEFAHQGTLAN